jgi:hypothetical protein
VGVGVAGTGVGVRVGVRVGVGVKVEGAGVAVAVAGLGVGVEVAPSIPADHFATPSTNPSFTTRVLYWSTGKPAISLWVTLMAFVPEPVREPPVLITSA